MFCGVVTPLSTRGRKRAKQRTTRYAGARQKLYKEVTFPYNRGVQAEIIERKGDKMANANNSLAHTKWMCKYHIVFTPKYRRRDIIRSFRIFTLPI